MRATISHIFRSGRVGVPCVGRLPLLHSHDMGFWCPLRRVQGRGSVGGFPGTAGGIPLVAVSGLPCRGIFPVPNAPGIVGLSRSFGSVSVGLSAPRGVGV